MPICKHVLAQTSPNAGRIAELMALSDAERFARLHNNAVIRMAQIDDLPPEWRRLVHEFGWTAVRRLRKDRVSFRTAQATLLGGALDL